MQGQFFDSVMTFVMQPKLQRKLKRQIKGVKALIEKRELMMDQRLEVAETEQDFFRIRKLQARIVRSNALLDELTEQKKSFAPAPKKDAFSITSRIDEDGKGVYDISITNSPYDNTYVPNDPLVFQYQGCKTEPDDLISFCSTAAVELASGDYWDVGSTGTKNFSVKSAQFATLISDYDASGLIVGFNQDPLAPTKTLEHIKPLFNGAADVALA